MNKIQISYKDVGIFKTKTHSLPFPLFVCLFLSLLLLDKAASSAAWSKTSSEERPAGGIARLSQVYSHDIETKESDLTEVLTKLPKKCYYSSKKKNKETIFAQLHCSVPGVATES